MTATRVLVVSDSHLSSRTPEALANWDAVVAHIAHDEPDIVVHAGDVSTDGAELGDDLAFACAQLGRIERPVYVLPGNHDMGDNPHAGNPDGGNGREPLVDAGRLARYREHLPPDRWTVDVPGWRLIGLNALLFDSGLADEDEQWRWFDDQLTSVGRRRIGIFVHKPVVSAPSRLDDTGETSPGRYVPRTARERILATGARLVVSGHVHQFCRHRTNGATHVWAPTTWAVLPDRIQPTIGDKVCGVAELVLHDDGICETELMLPYGIVQQTILDDVASPYS